MELSSSAWYAVIPKLNIADGAKVNQNVSYTSLTQSVYVLANGNSYITAVAGSGGIGASGGIGGVVNVVSFTKSTKAYIGDNAQVAAQKNIVVSAEASQLLIGVAVSVFGAGATAASGDVGTFTFENTTEAYIGTGADVIPKAMSKYPRLMIPS